MGLWRRVVVFVIHAGMLKDDADVRAVSGTGSNAEAERGLAPVGM
jgi:hypothetical protein